jgi:hypothetical protein
MLDSDVLLTMAEVAVAFAGFASLVSILGQQDSVDPPLVLAFRMRGMLLTSLLVVGFALLPIVLNEFGLGPRTEWTLASVSLLGASLAYARWLLRAFADIGRARLRPTAFQRRVVIPTLLLTLAAVVLLLTANLLLAHPAMYLSALLLLLVQSGFAFSLIVFSFLPRHDERGPSE